MEENSKKLKVHKPKQRSRLRSAIAGIFTICAISGISACSRGSSAEQNDLKQPESVSQLEDSKESSQKVLFIGTSLTAGYGLDPLDAYPAKVKELAMADGVDIEVINAGVSGETSAGAVRRVRWALNSKPDVVVVETGANDGLRGLPVSELETNLSDILDSIRTIAPNAQVLIMPMEAPPNLGSRYVGEFRSAYSNVARRSGADLGGFLLDGVAGVASLNQGDGIHPNGAGALIVAKNVWKALHPVVLKASNR